MGLVPLWGETPRAPSLSLSSLLPSCSQKEEAPVSAVSWPPPTHQQKRPREEAYTAGTLILTSSPKMAARADWLGQTKPQSLSQRGD